MMHIAVVGLGKLGSSLAAVLASHKHQVTGVDINEATVEQINKGHAPVAETGLDELTELAHPYLFATTDIAQAVSETTLAFVVVPTPSLDNGRFSNHYVIEAVEQIGEALRDTDKWYTVAVVSTVMPGSIRGTIAQALEVASGRTVGVDLSLVYTPTLIALGSVIHGLTHPEVMLIGADEDEPGANTVRKALESIVKSRPAWHHLSTVDAELAKLGLNVGLVTKISYANQMAELCEAMPGADARAVLRAIGSDSRIGSKFLSPGGPAAGPCLPRDCTAFAACARDSGSDALLANAAGQINEVQPLRIAARAVNADRVGILGVAYKPNTSVTEASLGVALASILQGAGVEVVTFDPAALCSIGSIASSAAELVARCDTIIVATPWPEFAGIDYGNRRVIDVWGILPPEPNIERIGVSLD